MILPIGHLLVASVATRLLATIPQSLPEVQRVANTPSEKPGAFDLRRTSIIVDVADAISLNTCWDITTRNEICTYDAETEGSWWFRCTCACKSVRSARKNIVRENIVISQNGQNEKRKAEVH